MTNQQTHYEIKTNNFRVTYTRNNETHEMVAYDIKTEADVVSLTKRINGEIISAERIIHTGRRSRPIPACLLS